MSPWRRINAFIEQIQSKQFFWASCINHFCLKYQGLATKENVDICWMNEYAYMRSRNAFCWEKLSAKNDQLMAETSTIQLSFESQSLNQYLPLCALLVLHELWPIMCDQLNCLWFSMRGDQWGENQNVSTNFPWIPSSIIRGCVIIR